MVGGAAAIDAVSPLGCESQSHMRGGYSRDWMQLKLRDDQMRRLIQGGGGELIKSPPRPFEANELGGLISDEWQRVGTYVAAQLGGRHVDSRGTDLLQRVRHASLGNFACQQFALGGYLLLKIRKHDVIHKVA